MVISRVTQRMLTNLAVSSLDSNLAKMSAAQTQLSTGKRITKPSDDPVGTTTAMRARAASADQTQYQRNAQDGISWLTVIDGTLSSISSQVTRAYTLAIQGANSGSQSDTSRGSIADEIDQIRDSVVAAANTTYLGRPIFGGTTTNGVAYTTDDSDPDNPVVNYVGDDGSVNRRVGDDQVIRVDSSGAAAFGATDGTGDDLFSQLTALSSALRSGDEDAISQGVGNMQSSLSRISGAMADEGARYNAIGQATTRSTSAQLSLESTRSTAEDADIAQATIEVQIQSTAYQAALAATSKAVQPSLLDFLK